MSFNERDHPRDKDGKFSNGESFSKPSVKEQIKSKKSLINTTKTISLDTDSSSTKQEKARFVQIQLQNSGGIVNRKDIGDVQVGNRISDGLKYVKTKSEEYAILAVPSVIENGVIIHEMTNHKGRNYKTITIANKVQVSGDSGVIAVVVMQTPNNNYKVHRVTTLDGKDLEI